MSTLGNAPQVVLIADEFEGRQVGPFQSRRDLEMSDIDTINQLIATIGDLGRTVVHYSSPQELAENASKHRDAVVLSIYGGQSSRNRMALVPAICESFDLRFIGPDVYGRIIAQDKEVSKRLALDAGLKTPSWRVLRSPKDISSIERIKLPCVIKPLLEGSSIGITQKNLVREVDDALRLASHLLADMRQPIIVEEFVAGQEVAFVAIENQGSIHWAYSELVVEGCPNFFHERLFDATEKANPTPGRTVINTDCKLNDEDRTKLETFLSMLGRFGYCRVDGRHADGRFHFLEVTPDAWIDPKGQFAMAFTEKGWNYKNIIRAVLASGD